MISEVAKQREFVLLGNKLRRALTNSGVSQTAVAEHLGVRQNTVSSWVRGRTCPNARQIVEVGKLTGRDAAWFGDDDRALDEPPQSRGVELEEAARMVASRFPGEQGRQVLLAFLSLIPTRFRTLWPSGRASSNLAFGMLDISAGAVGTGA